MNSKRRQSLRYLLPTALLVVMAAACQPRNEALPTATAETEAPAETAAASLPTTIPSTSAPQPTTEPSPTAEPLPAGETIPDEEVAQLLVDLIGGDPDAAEAAVVRIVDAGDIRFIPVFIELMRASQIGIVRGGYDLHIESLERLSSQSFGDSWPDWIEWYGATEVVPPPGFTSWKGLLLARLDPQFAKFLRDEFPSRIRVEEIQWGGVVVDGIPALDNAGMIEADKATYLQPEEPVFGIALNGDARAYPLRILDWHEMANDVVGGIPVSLAYCTLCGAAIAFDGRASDGNTYTFGSSGFLVRSNKLMYDRQTYTLWNQLTGEPVLGELAGTDLRLNLLPVVLTTWKEWQNQHPDTRVLDLDTGFNRVYEPGAAYGDYFADSGTMFPVWQRSSLLPAKERVYALRLDGAPKAYPIAALAAKQVVNDTIGQTPIVLVATRGVVNVDGDNLRLGPVAYEAGAEVRAYERNDETFTPGLEPDVVLDSAGRPWQVTEDALIGPGGEEAPRISGHLAYWFGWYTFFPNTQLYGHE